jgi:lysophospholipase-2
MPYAKFILPTAPTQPVTLCKGKSMPSWFDIGGSDERSNKLCHGILQSRDRIHAILGNEYNNGIPYSRMVLVGFSQGGALCLFAGLSLPPSPTTDKKLARILVMSAFLAGMSTFQHTPGLEDTNILHLHGLKDPKVHYSKALKCRELLSLKGFKNYTIITYPGLQHTVSQNELEDALIFLRRTLPPLDDHSCLHIKTSDISTAGFKNPVFEEIRVKREGPIDRGSTCLKVITPKR